ncbi:hypothetical protein UFOVP53_125 [uncultured Caudovirales phage]|uniref:Uncharacterized protein n=1 Tax=uncultured Caudovirales phage TaxID=2100421 RepID=A0A6J5KWJ9_9CAUD|nr:hypothetical protein UFOVP53_125 [uncultured Caudovirales phage]
MSGCHCAIGCSECRPSYKEIWDSKAEFIVDEFSYTLKRFGLINRVIRAQWAIELEILLLEGKAAVEQYRRMLEKEWDNYN